MCSTLRQSFPPKDDTGAFNSRLTSVCPSLHLGRKSDLLCRSSQLATLSQLYLPPKSHKRGFCTMERGCWHLSLYCTVNFLRFSFLKTSLRALKNCMISALSSGKVKEGLWWHAVIASFLSSPISLISAFIS